MDKTSLQAAPVLKIEQKQEIKFTPLFHIIMLFKAAKGIIFHLWHESWNGSVPHERYPWQHYIVFTSESAGHHLYR